MEKGVARAVWAYWMDRKTSLRIYLGKRKTLARPYIAIPISLSIQNIF